MVTAFVIGLIFAPLTAAMAVLITHHENEHHRFERRRMIRFDVESAVVVFLLFLALSVASGLLTARW